MQSKDLLQTQPIKHQEILTTPITFLASANCALYCNALPRFVDVNEQGLIDTLNRNIIYTKGLILRTKFILNLTILIPIKFFEFNNNIM